MLEPGVNGPTGPNRSKIFKILLVLVQSGPRTKTEPLGPGPTGFGPWIPGLDKINKNSKSTESHQSGWSDDHVSISSSDYQTSSKINKTETSKSSDDLEKDHGNNYVIMTS